MNGSALVGQLAAKGRNSDIRPPNGAATVEVA